MSFSYGPIVPAVTSDPIAVTYDATISSDTSVTLNALTTGIEVTAIDKAILLRWDAAAATSAFDGVIPLNTTKIFAVPRGALVAHFIEQAATAVLVCVEF